MADGLWRAGRVVRRTEHKQTHEEGDAGGLTERESKWSWSVHRECMQKPPSQGCMYDHSGKQPPLAFSCSLPSPAWLLFKECQYCKRMHMCTVRLQLKNISQAARNFTESQRSSWEAAEEESAGRDGQRSREEFLIGLFISMLNTPFMYMHDYV